MQNASYIFQVLKTNGYLEIKRFIENKQEENLFLDFKEKSDNTYAGIQNDDKKNFAKALSAFSNSVGGVLVWGIKAKKLASELPDVACEEHPISHLKRFLTDLNSLTSQALIPLNVGIINEIILFPDSEDKGFVITYIPESNLPPHRALLGLNQYFTRSGDSCMMMEHHMLEDSFGRRQKPKLEIYFQVFSLTRLGNGDTVIAELVIGIKNIGRYIATYPAIRIIPIKGDLRLSIYGVDGNRNWVLNPVKQTQYTKDTNGHFFAGTINDVIHPNTHLDIAVFRPSENMNKGQIIISGLKTLPPAESYWGFDYEIFAEGIESVSGNVSISVEEIIAGLIII